MTLYPNNSTKQVVDNELNKKLKKFDERIENNSSEITSLKSRVSNTEDNITSINGDIEGLEEDIGSLDTRVDTVELALDEKQDTLNFDNSPTYNSDNPVKSGGIYDALETKLDKESVKFDPEPNGTDALSTGGAYDIVQDLNEKIDNVQNQGALLSNDNIDISNNGCLKIDNQQEVETNAIEVLNGDTKLKDTEIDGDLSVSGNIDGNVATHSANGLMSSEDKVRLDAIDSTIEDKTVSDTLSDSTSQIPSSAAVTDILSNLPTDAVLHYSFDEVPDYPDGTAVYKKDNDFTDITGWTGLATQTINNGKLTVEGNATAWAKYNINLYQNQIILIKGVAKVSSTEIIFSVHNKGASSDTMLARMPTTAGQPIEIIGVVNADSSGFVFYSDYQWGIEISQIYIGDGSYSTPVIDNANGKWNSVSQSGVAVKGVSGKAIRFLGSNYIRGNLPWKPYDKAVFTVSMWVKNWDMSTDLELINDWDTLADTATPLFAKIYSPSTSHNLALYIFVKTEGNYTRRFQILKNNFDYNELNDIAHIVAVFNDTNSVIYINGKKFELLLTDVYPLDSQVINNQFFQVGAVNTNTNVVTYTKATFDDLLIFDRALTETEVKALYYNKANTPKYYNLNNFKLDLIPLPPSTNGTYQLTATVSNGSISYSWV